VIASRVGVLGGTFDPIHVGHLAVASEVCAALGLDEVLIAPTASQPFKDAQDSAAPEHRVAMCELAVRADPRLSVTTVDVDRGGVTYTVDTLRDLAARRPDTEWYFIAGADSLERLSEWKEPETLLTLATFVGVTRPGHSLARVDPVHPVVEVPALGVSSTEIRRRVRMAAPIRYLVPDAVADYISAHGLYFGGFDD
jgi:nicotinate-nucleotide adenylyltransferase